MSNINFSLGIYNKRFNCYGPCPPKQVLPKNSILMPNHANISRNTKHAASIRIQSHGGGRMRLGGIKGGGIPPSRAAIPATPGAIVEGWKDTGEGPQKWGDSGCQHQIASSTTGDKLVATARQANIFLSTDYGVSWVNQTTPASLTGEFWKAVASDSTGTNLAAVSGIGNIFLSHNSGVAWSELTTGPPFPPPNQIWRGIALNHDGTIIVAVAKSPTQVIYVSIDSGVSWTLQASGEQFQCVTCQTVGGGALTTKLAVTVFAGNIWTSPDSGTTWVDVNTLGGTPPTPNLRWQGISADATATNLAAVSNNNSAPVGSIWLSKNSGVDWVEVAAGQPGIVTAPPVDQKWADVAISSTGTIIVAVINGGNIWKSTDSGANWIEDTTVGAPQIWTGVTSNAAGDRLAAEVWNGNIWTWPTEVGPPAVLGTPAFSCAPAPPYPAACIKPPRNKF